MKNCTFPRLRRQSFFIIDIYRIIRKNSFSEAISVCSKLLDNAQLLNEEQIIFCNENLSYAYGKVSKGRDFQKAIDFAKKAI